MITQPHACAQHCQEILTGRADDSPALIGHSSNLIQIATHCTQLGDRPPKHYEFLLRKW